ncbi:Oidioi.mRNA.OKI2018_I69.PAR.g13186.t1.cds [Oikopleura dioica]|uniref:Oidioi.mRNA.OKI2018_I69.PAR.g13186.t1.cds n=1 Tax=Oikopleura dioica TaxID=34765 RepID=A0ABN7SBH3_OIKDI|nr:Oidioi.mRNA.OKI2018_I69.PAR.g13186.t1.cds [Oikopleura dioica]
MNRAVQRVNRLPRLPKSTNPPESSLPQFFENLRGVFPVYKPPHTNLIDLKANIEDTLLENYDNLPFTEDIPLLLPSESGGEVVRSEAPDRRFLPSVENKLERIKRIGLQSRFFPEIGFHSSGLTFCAIGKFESPEEEIFTRYIQRGQTWHIKLLLGISTGETVHPEEITPEDIKLIEKEGLFTVEGFLLARQKIKNDEKSCRRLLKLSLDRLVTNERYKIMEKYLYEYGPDESFVNISLGNKDWLNEFYSTAVTRVLDGQVLSFSKETNELELELQILGNPTHHFFGVLGDYFTKNALGVNSAVVSSRRCNFGGARMTEISENALTHYEIYDIERIKESVKATKKYAKTIQKRLKSEADSDYQKYQQLVKEKGKFVKKVQNLTERVEKRSSAIQEKQIELSKTTSLLDQMIASG